MIKHFSLRSVVLGALLLSPVALFTGCEAQKGPAEKAGERIDKAGQNAKDAIDPAGPGEKAGRDLDKATGNKP